MSSQTAPTSGQLEGSPWVDDPIAIVGIGLRLPGSVRTPQQYWEFLTSKGSGRGRVPANRYNVDAFFGPKGKPGHTYTEYGYFLEDLDLAAVDSSFWSMPPKELELMDPQQRLMMEVVYECLESSGRTAFKGKNIGCYVGVLGEDWMDIQTKDPQHPGMHRVAGYGDFAISNRISKELGLTGPSMTIRTACSSSLMALHSACHAIYAGECSSAVVGGCNLILSPRMTVTMSEYRVISPTGYCRSFDANADGYARGEAINAIHIKRLSHALRDGDPIRAVIRSVCINSDGQRSPLFIPSPDSHELLIRRCHQLAGITDLSKTAMIECHGTGTVVGDTLEASAVARVFGKLGGILIGSVKPNIGHSEGASGLSSIIKMVLALENQTIPPNINFTTPSPRIPFGPARLRVPVECEPWPKDKAERVGLNGFGIGGANGHVLLESARSVVGTVANGVATDENPSRLLVFSATHSEVVKRSISNTLDYVSKNPSRVAAASYTLACRRERFPKRAFALGSSDSWDVSPVQEAGPVPDLVWVFTGQGSQYSGMGRELVMNSAVARDTIQRLDQVLDDIATGRTWSLHEELFRSESSSRLFSAEYSQPCSTAIQIALVDVLKALNILPSAVVGHSAGEIAAAYAADALTAAEAITVAYHRGQVARRAEITGNGGMMAVGLGREQVSPLLVEGVTIACENSPKSVTLSGKLNALDVVVNEIQSHHPDTVLKRLRVNCAYHTAQMKDVEDDYHGRLAGIQVLQKPLSMLFVSSVSGKPVNDAAELGPDYWCRNLTSPVLFYSAVTDILQNDTLSNPVFLEVGPHSALSGILHEIGFDTDSKSIPYIPTLVRETNAYDSILRTAGRLFQFNTNIDLSTLCTGTILADLPSYPWQYDGRFWSESRVSRNWRFREYSNHDVLGSKIPDGNDKEPIWRSMVYLENIPWIREHIINDKIVFPRAGYIAMAGEAIRQLAGQTDFSLRNVNFLSDLLLRENSPNEIMTQFRPSRLTIALESDWYDFTITSFFDGVWTKHCTGQARGGRHVRLDNTYPRPGARKVKHIAWYHAMERFGATYGPRFRGMQQITASVTSPEATAEVIDFREEQESFYIVHPCTIDAIFQLLNVTESQGIARHLKHLSVPTHIDEVYFRPPSGLVTARAAVSVNSEDVSLGHATGFCGEELVFSLRRIRLSPMPEGKDIRGVDPHAGARLVWKPDFDQVDINTLVRPAGNISDHLFLIEDLALACMVESKRQTCDITPSLPHYTKFYEWLRTQCQRAEQGHYDNVPSCQVITELPSADRRRYIKSLYSKALETDSRYAAIAIHRIYEHSTALFEGKVDPLSLLMEDDLLTAIYGFAQLCDFTDFFRVFAHNRPSMRVLEIGAGTGGVTATILPALRGPHGERMYDSYTYTDISPGFLDVAQDRFKDYDSVVYRTLDITTDPLSQGFDVASYDLIVASNVIHVTASLQQSLSNVRTLLKPSGKLFLQELSPITKWINYVMGTLPGWWLGEPDGRAWEPYVSPERWDKELRGAGLSGTDAVIHDGHMNAHIISSAPAPQILSRKDRRVTVLCGDISADVDLFVSLLRNRGFEADVRHIGDERPDNQIIVSLLELDAPQLHSLSPAQYLDLRDLITSLDRAPMLWVTRSSQVSCSDPRYAATLGLLRTARRELAVTVATLELDVVDGKAFQTAVTVMERLLQNEESNSSLDPVLEYVYAYGTLMTGRFYPAVIDEELCNNSQLAMDDSAAAVLRIDKRGQIETLSWTPKSNTTPVLVDDWVEVETRVVGLNSKDLLMVTGIADGNSLGAECSGTVRRIGPGVKNLRVGDQVIVLSSGTLATHVVASEKLCARMAHNLNWVEAATLPYVFATALYSLIDIARLKHGDTVLIHSACSGVGLAAIQVCRIIGAQIYCTAQSEEIDHLVQLGIPRERVFQLHDSTFLQDILTATNGRGVDVVLNSLSGELLHASWQCVAEFGIMVELGKQDLIGKGQLAMDIFEKNRTFAAVDLAQMCEKRPGIIQGLLRRCMHHYALGELNPLPVQEFPAEHVEQAFRHIKKGTHIGKIAILMPDEPSTLHVNLTRRIPHFRSDSCHLIVGGLGGLGRSISSWMSLNGACHFVFFSPSAASKEQDEFVLELRAQGCRVDLVSGDVGRSEDIDALIRALGDVPVAGVMQASMALQVTSLDTMSFEQWQVSVAPKVQGTWNLHNSLLKYRRPVDYFVLFSSFAGLIGQTGHANYAAGNAFLDAFVQYRHSLGLPCSAIDIGVMEDVGYVSNQPHILDHFQSTSSHMLHEQDLLDTIQLAIDNSIPPPVTQKEGATWPSYVSHSQICIGLRSTSPLDSPTNRTSWRRDPRMALYHNFDKAASKDTSSNPDDSKNDQCLERFLQQAKLQPEILAEPASVDLLAEVIGKTLFNFMLRDHSELDYNVPLASLGADSLLAIKLREWFRRQIGLNITVVDILSSGSLRKLGETAAEKMVAKMACTDPAPA